MGFLLPINDLFSTPKPTPLLDSYLPMAIRTKYPAFIYFFLNPSYRPTTGHHPCDFHIFFSDMMKLQNLWIRFTTVLTGMRQKVLVNIFPCSFTGCFSSFLHLLQMPFFCITLIVCLVVRVGTFTARRMPDTQHLVSPVKLFFVFFLTTVVTNFLCHDLLRKDYLRITILKGHVILKLKRSGFF